MIRKTCPMNGLTCKNEGCGWWCDEDRKCAVALIPSTLDWLARFAATKPFEKTEDEDG